MARLVAMSILPDHTGAENRQFLIRFRNISKHTIQFLCKTLLASNQTDQAIQILRNRPEILPAIALTNIFGIIVGD